MIKTFLQSRSGRIASAVVRMTLAGALLYYIATSTSDWTPIQRLFRQGWIIAGVVAMPFAGAVLEAIRLRLVIKAQGITMSVGKLYRFIAVANFFNYAMPGGNGGDVVKLYYLASDQRGRGLEMATMLGVDRAVALFSWLLVVVGLGLLNLGAVLNHLPVLMMIGGAVGMMVVLLLVAVLSTSPILRRTRLFTYLTTRAPLHPHIARVADALQAYRTHRDVLLLATMWSVPGHIAVASMFALTGTILIPDAPPQLVGLLALLGMLANVLPITPGGLGVGEAAFHGLFRMFGFAGGAHLMLAWRAALMPFSIVGGILYMRGSSRRGAGRIQQVSVPRTNRPAERPEMVFAAERVDVNDQ